MLKKDEVQDLIKNETIRSGMIPKVTRCVDALHGGVKKTGIIDGRVVGAPPSRSVHRFGDGDADFGRSVNAGKTD